MKVEGDIKRLQIMNYREKIRELASRNRLAQTEEEKETIRQEMMKLQEENPEEYQSALEGLIQETAKECETLRMADKLGEMTKIVSMSYIAKHYFGKTRSWIAHKLNGNSINGKKSDFTDAEVQTLKFALRDISEKLGSLSATL